MVLFAGMVPSARFFHAFDNILSEGPVKMSLFNTGRVMDLIAAADLPISSLNTPH